MLQPNTTETPHLRIRPVKLLCEIMVKVKGEHTLEGLKKAISCKSSRYPPFKTKQDWKVQQRFSNHQMCLQVRIQWYFKHGSSIAPENMQTSKHHFSDLLHLLFQGG